MSSGIRVEVTNRQGVLANFVAKEEDLLKAALGTVDRYRGMALEYAQSIVPVDTGRMRRSLRAEFVGPGKRVWELYYDPEVFQADGVVYYPVFVEYGTSRQAAQPTLRMTTQRVADPFRRDLLQSMRRAA